MKLVLYFAVALALIMVPLAKGQVDESISQQLQKLERQWGPAAQKQDAGPLADLYADDYTLTNPVGQVVPKSVMVEKVKDGTFKVESVEYANMKVRTYGDTAIVIGRLTIKGAWDGNDVGGEYAFTDTFVKQGGKWREVASQVTRIEG
jgi:uncharacterized protein (TIGR02246 family)